MDYFIYIKHGKQVYNAWIRGANFGMKGGVCENYSIVHPIEIVLQIDHQHFPVQLIIHSTIQIVDCLSLSYKDMLLCVIVGKNTMM